MRQTRIETPGSSIISMRHNLLVALGRIDTEITRGHDGQKEDLRSDLIARRTRLLSALQQLHG